MVNPDIRHKDSAQRCDQQLYELILANLYSGVLVILPEGVSCLVNQSFCDLFDLNISPAACVGKTSAEILELILGKYQNPAMQLQRIKDIVTVGAPVRGEEVQMRDGRTFLRDFIPMMLDGQTGGRIWHHTDITAQREAERRTHSLLSEKEMLIRTLALKNDELTSLAATDSLTGLHNRQQFEVSFASVAERFNQFDEALSIILVDLDHFKKINDVFGHQAGDTVLRHVARLIRNATRASDMVFRWGGEEFVVLTQHTNLQQCMVLAEHLRAAICAEALAPVGIVTASFGVAELKKGESVESWFRRCDIALYRAKAEGRNQVFAG